jgi:uncharacterized protein YyaL (SSP411 family)
MAGTISWREWGDAAFAEATRANVPIVLSLSTAWSEACRAMDRTTFINQDVVSTVTEHFVPVRVDADRHPDVNERYNLGGWPTTAFVTPGGDVLIGGTYLDASQFLTMAGRVRDAWRERAGELQARAITERASRESGRASHGDPDRGAAAHVQALMLEQFDPVHGGFGPLPKVPHVAALRLALSLLPETSGAAHDSLRIVVEATLEALEHLWDSTGGGYVRYASEPDWGRPAGEKTLEDNAALLHLYLDAAAILDREDYRLRAGRLVQWVKSSLANGESGFSNAESNGIVDRVQYVDRNARIIGGFLRASAMFGDPWLRDSALKAFEAAVLPGYVPGSGVAHVEGVRGLLGDQIDAADAAIWAHAATEQIPYSMLAAELTEYALRTMWDEREGAFRDRVGTEDPLAPFERNCEAACVLERLATLTGNESYRRRAHTVLAALAGEYKRHGLFGAPYALAVREVLEHQPPPGLVLRAVDWGL